MKEAIDEFVATVEGQDRIDVIMIAAVDSATGWSFGEVWRKPGADLEGSKEALLAVLAKYKGGINETIN